MEVLDLLHPQGIDNPGGTATLHGYALLDWFTDLKQPVDMDAVGATMETIGKIATAHTFAATKAMKKAYGTEGMGSVKVEPVGELDGGGFKSTFVFKHPGSKAELDGFARFFANNSAIFFPQESDGTVRQIGSERFPAKVKVNYSTGDNNEGYRGYEVTVTAYGQAPIYVPGLNFTPAV